MSDSVSVVVGGEVADGLADLPVVLDAGGEGSAARHRSAPAAMRLTTRWPKPGSRPFKTELVDGRRFPSYEHAEHETLHWIGFYNEQKLHEQLGDVPPAEYEQIAVKTDNRAKVAAT
jgi:transposase InsO family protein